MMLFCLDAKRIMPKFDGIEVHFDNFPLRVPLFETHGREHFFELAGDCLFSADFFIVEISCELHGDR